MISFDLKPDPFPSYLDMQSHKSPPPIHIWLPLLPTSLFNCENTSSPLNYTWKVETSVVPETTSILMEKDPRGKQEEKWGCVLIFTRFTQNANELSNLL